MEKPDGPDQMTGGSFKAALRAAVSGGFGRQRTRDEDRGPGSPAGRGRRKNPGQLEKFAIGKP